MDNLDGTDALTEIKAAKNSKPALLVAASAFLTLISCSNTPEVSWRVTPSFAGLSSSDANVLKSELINICAGPTAVNQVKRYLKQKLLPKEIQEKNAEMLFTIAGCMSWFELTDKEADKTFEKARNILPGNNPIQCISVGFVQPWLMLKTLPCEELIFLDANPHLLSLQSRLVAAMLSDGKRFDIDNFLKDQVFPFATSKKIQNPRWNQKLSLEDICGTEYSQNCREAFRKGSDSLRKVKSIAYLRGLLHESVEHLPQTGKPKIFYLSNSLDPIFINEAEFRVFRDKYAKITSGTGIFIYHMASEKEFGIYRVEKSTVQSLCSDRFMVRFPPIKDPCYPKPIIKKPFEMLTWADKMAGEKINTKVNPCLIPDSKTH